MKNWKFILPLIVLIGLVFYWYDFRLSQVRKKCHAEALENAVLDTNQPQYYNDNLIERTEKQNQLIDASYINCVRGKGLEK